MHPGAVLAMMLTAMVAALLLWWGMAGPGLTLVLATVIQFFVEMER